MTQYAFSNKIQREQTGTISEVLGHHIVKEVNNDGAHYFGHTEVDPESQMPCGYSGEIILPFTDKMFDVTQMDQTFISATLHATLHFSSDMVPALSPTTDAQRGMFIHVGLKSGSNVFKDYAIHHRGRIVDFSLQNNATVESFLMNLYLDKATKNNAKHSHSLWNNVHNFDTSNCGTYISYFDLANLAANSYQHIVDIPINIPLTNLLPLQAFTEYPNSLFGDLKIVFKLNPAAFVFTMVDPVVSMRKYWYSNGFPAAMNTTIQEQITTICNSLPHTADYTRMFTQFGLHGNVAYGLQGDGTLGRKTISIMMTDYQITKCKCMITGYRMEPSALAQERIKYQREPYVFPAQKLEIYQFPSPVNGGALSLGQNMPLHSVTDFILLFPKYAQQITCFENPMLQGLYLACDGRNYPTKPIRTDDNAFFGMMMNNSDLDNGLEPTDEYEDSLTIPRATSKTRLRPTTDLTSFAITLKVERPSAARLIFDGLDSGGQNVNVTLHGNPILQGSMDTYYDVEGTGSTPHPPAPILCTVQDTFWVFNSRDGGQCMYKNTNFNDEVRKFMN